MPTGTIAIIANSPAMRTGTAAPAMTLRRKGWRARRTGVVMISIVSPWWSFLGSSVGDSPALTTRPCGSLLRWTRAGVAAEAVTAEPGLHRRQGRVGESPGAGRVDQCVAAT